MTKERGGGLIFFAVGVYALTIAIKLPLGRWNEPGPGVLPLFLSISLTIAGIAWFIIGKSKEGEKVGTDWRRIAKLLKTPSQIILLTACFVLTMGRIGYLIGSVIYLFITFLWVSHFKLRIAIGLALLIGVGSWYFFQKILVIQLPAMGIWIL